MVDLAKKRPKEKRLDGLFGALADPTRRRLIHRLATKGEATVSELAQPFAMSLQAISKHLVMLERAGLVSRRKVGREHRVQLDASPLQSIAEWAAFYQRFWTRKLADLAAYLENDVEAAATSAPATSTSAAVASNAVSTAAAATKSSSCHLTRSAKSRKESRS